MSDAAPSPDRSPRNTPDDPPPVTQGPHEIVRHALGANEPVGEASIDPDEERRRLVATEFESQRLAKKRGLLQHASRPFPIDAPSSAEAAEITREATPLMHHATAEAAAMVGYRKERRENRVTGETVVVTDIKFNFFAPITKPLEQLVAVVGRTLKGKFSFNVKVGKQGFELGVKAEGSQE